jgi:hypothetical protein
MQVHAGGVQILLHKQLGLDLLAHPGHGGHRLEDVPGVPRELVEPDGVRLHQPGLALAQCGDRLHPPLGDLVVQDGALNGFIGRGLGVEIARQGVTGG